MSSRPAKRRAQLPMSSRRAPTLAFGRVLETFFALMRRDCPRARTSVSALARTVRDHDLPEFRAFGELLVGWATIDGGALADGLEAMRRGAESLRRQNVVVYDGLVKIALAEAEGRAGDPDRALKNSRRSAGDLRPHGLPRVRMRAPSGARRTLAQAASR